MMVAALLAVHLLGHGHQTKVKVHQYQVHGWHVRVSKDAFTGAITCQVKSRNISLLRQTLIFHLGGGDTTNAYFRIDGGQTKSVRAVFAEDMSHDFFPERGWIENPNGGDVALPAAYMTAAKQVFIRVSPKSRLHTYDVSRFPEALSRARAAGCTAEKTID